MFATQSAASMHKENGIDRSHHDLLGALERATRTAASAGATAAAAICNWFAHFRAQQTDALP